MSLQVAALLKLLAGLYLSCQSDKTHRRNLPNLAFVAAGYNLDSVPLLDVKWRPLDSLVLCELVVLPLFPWALEHASSCWDHMF